MSNADHEHPNYVAVWAWLVFLLIISVAAAYLPFSTAAVVTIIFTVALAKAVLVAANFMHLRFETRLIRAIAIVPVVLFIIMTLTLLPDIVFYK
jgi:caa(3)-type oxidase subunit IV